MCGIVGYVGARAPMALAPLIEVLRHRGPDDRGEYRFGGVALGMCRLAIIDPEHGRQPWVREEGVLIFNGEVYNHPELRRELEGAGERFRTASDVEVIAAALARWGEAALERFDGMFALAWWDRRRRRLLLARDLFGQKPLYWALRADTLYFASELGALRAIPGVCETLRGESLCDLLCFGAIGAPFSVYREVFQLPPGHCLVFADGRARKRRFRGISVACFPGPRSERELADELRARLDAAVRRHMKSDVPVALSLSGGADSSAILALATRAGLAFECAVTVRFPGHPAYCEDREAGALARHFGARHELIDAGPEILDCALSLIAGMGEPHANSSDMVSALVARRVAPRAKVLLLGTGGDELFAGYPRHAAFTWAHRFGFFRGASAGALARGLARLPDALAGEHWRRRAQSFLEGFSLDPATGYWRWHLRLAPERLAKLATPEFARFLGLSAWAQGRVERFREITVRDQRDRPLWGDLDTWLPDDLLITADRAAMAHSVEARLPWLDPDLAGFALGLPHDARRRPGSSKRLLRLALGDMVPSGLLTRRKQGFQVPLGAYLRGPWRCWMEDTLSPPALSRNGWWRPQAVRALVERHLKGRIDESRALWPLLVLTTWRERSMLRSPV